MDERTAISWQKGMNCACSNWGLLFLWGINGPHLPKKKKKKSLHWNESSPCLGLRFTAQRVTAPPKNSHHMDASHDLLLACWLVESRCFSSHQPGWEGWLVMFRNVWVKMFWMFICRVQRSLVQSEKMVLTIDCKRFELTVLLYLHSLLTVLYNTVMTKKLAVEWADINCTIITIDST